MPDETIEELHETYGDYETHYKGFYSAMTKAKQFYDLDFTIVKPPNVDAVKPPTARTRIDQAVQELITVNPKVRRRRLKETTTAQSHDDQIEKGLQAFLLNAEEYAQTPLLQEASKLQIMRGAAVFAGPFYDKIQNLCYFDVYDPLTVLIEPGAFPRQGFVHVSLTVAEMEQLSNRVARLKGFDRKTRKSTDEIEFVQWWKYEAGEDGKLVSGRYAAWIKDDEDFVCSPTPSGYPYLPLDMVWSGWGQRHLGSKPEETGISLLHGGAQTLLQAEAEGFTMQQANALSSTWGRYKARAGIPIAKDFAIDTAPNSITFDWPEGLEPIEVEGLPAEAGAHLDRVERRLDETLYSRILQGQRQPGVTTATAYSILTGRSRRRFDPPMRHLQAGGARLLLKVGQLLQFLTDMPGSEAEEKKFTWRGVDLEAKLYEGDLTVELDLAAEDDEERRLKIAEGVSLWDKMDHRYIGEEYFGRENWTEAEEQMAFEAIIHSQQFVDVVLELFVGIAQKRQADQQTEAAAEADTGTLNRLGSAFRAARTGTPPTQPGTVESAAARLGGGTPI